MSEFTPEQEAAIMRSNAAAERGDMEEAIDALASIGLIKVSIDKQGRKLYSMDDPIAKVIMDITNEDGTLKEGA